MTEKKDLSIGLRNLRINDYTELKSSMIKAYPNWEEAYWKEHHIASLFDRFPEGQICVTVNDRVAARGCVCFLFRFLPVFKMDTSASEDAPRPADLKMIVKFPLLAV